MDWRDNSEQAAFRAEVRALIEARLPQRYREMAEQGGPGERQWEFDRKSPDAAAREAAVAWHAALAERGWVAPHWPKEYGGGGLTPMEQFVLNQEFARAAVPPVGGSGVGLLGPTLIIHGTPEQKAKYLPPILAGEATWAQGYSEPGSGSDLASLQTRAVRDGDDFVLNGQKMWLTNGGSSTLTAVLVRTEAEAPEDASVYKKMTTFLVEKPAGFGEVLPGLTIPGKIDKMGYKGVDTTEMVFDGLRVPADRILGGEPGKGFYQMMDGVEVGRVNVAARACGLALRAFELGIAYAQQRHTFGKQIADHQAVQFRLADMAVKVEAAHQMMVKAARLKDSGQRNDLEAGMAKYLASEYCRDVVEDSFRIHGGYGYAKEYEIERLYREAPMLLIGEGTADIQRMIIGRRLLEDYKAR